MQPTTRGWLVTLGLVALWGAPVGADRLVLRSGGEVRGQLVSVRDGVIEFEEDLGRRGARLRRFRRGEVEAIEFDEESVGVGAAGRPRGLREREVVASADVAWNDTRIDVREGQAVYFEAVGRVRWGRDRQDGPAGERGSTYNPNRPIPGRPAAALIGRIGRDSTDYFFIGDEQGAIRMPASGRLYLGINDDYLQDNSGNFRVTVYY